MDNFYIWLGFAIRDMQAFWNIHFASRTALEWLFFFVPFYVFGEFPRYMLPSFIMLIRHAMRPGRDDDDAKQRFMASRPGVSVLVVGLNEEDSIAHCIESLLEFDYPNLEIIVVDDHSTDRMYERAKPYADQGLIKLYRNTGASGRFGRPIGSNMAFRLATGDFILSVDADTSFDRDLLFHMIGPFYDPAVGGVAGNLRVRNVEASEWTRLQQIEYLQSIGLWKQWLNLWGANMQASGAIGAFRREALEACGAWDAELAEDADLSLKVKRSGWKIVFAPNAFAITNVPETLKQLVKQRYRWDRGYLRTYFHKHGSLLQFWRYDWRNAAEMSLQYFFQVFLTFLYVVWFGFMLAYYPIILVFVFFIVYFVYFLSSGFLFFVGLYLTERSRSDWPLVFSIPHFPMYKGLFRLVRLYSLTLEVFRLNYSDTYLPQSAWRNTRKW